MSKAKKGPVTEMSEKLALIEKECAGYKDQYMRSLADFDNYRRRMQRELECVRQTANESLVADLLPILDNFDRALATVKAGAEESESHHQDTKGLKGRTGEEPEVHHQDTKAQRVGGQTPDEEVALEKVSKGIELIRRQMSEALGRHGLEEFSCLGQEFDPRRAEAVSFVLSDEHKADTVVEEQCKGFSCRGKVIRPAKVVVAKPGRSEAVSSETVSSETAEKREQED